MRIVELSDQYLPSIGGTERHVARLSATLVERGHQVAVVTMARPGLAEYEVDEHGVEIIRVDAPELAVLRRFYNTPEHSFHPPVPLPGTTRALARAIAEWGADVVHGHNWSTYAYLAARERVPVVHTIHDYGMACPKMTLLRPDGSVCPGPALRRCIPCASTQYSKPVAAGLSVGLRAGRVLHGRIDRVLAVSALVADAHRDVFDQPIEVVPTFVADGLAERYADAPRPGFVPEGEYICFVGALSAHKGVPALLEAYKRLDNPCPLVLCGVRKHDTPDLDIDGVIVAENVAHPEVMGAWRWATVAVIPSLAETWGQVVAEAMTMGCPVVVSDAVGLAPQVRDAGAGVLVAPKDPDALAEALSGLLADAAARAEMGERGRELARDLTVSAVVGRLEEIFADVTGQG